MQGDNLVLAIAGDRYYKDYKTFSKVVSDELERFPASMIVTGDASGTDTMALQYCIIRGLSVRVYCASQNNFNRLVCEGVDAVLIADWDRDGKAAGPERTAALMADANRLLLFDGGGPGSKNLRKLAREMGKDVELWDIVGMEVAEQEISSRGIDVKSL